MKDSTARAKTVGETLSLMEVCRANNVSRRAPLLPSSKSLQTSTVRCDVGREVNRFVNERRVMFALALFSAIAKLFVLSDLNLLSLTVL
jgi:hypothetical protein